MSINKYSVHYGFIFSIYLLGYLSNDNYCTGSISIVNENNEKEVDHFENITVTVVYPEDEERSHLLRKKRSFAVYNCHRKSCTDGTCRPEFYEGPHPPEWCKQKPHQKSTKCSWTSSCWNKQCQTQSTSCRHQYDDIKNGKAHPRSTFNFECFQQKGYCKVVQCKGLSNCKKKDNISLRQFDNDFVNKLPNCNDMERKGKRSLDPFKGMLLRTKRAPASVLALQGYCCELGERWSGVIIANVRPIISR